MWSHIFCDPKGHVYAPCSWKISDSEIIKIWQVIFLLLVLLYYCLLPFICGFMDWKLAQFAFLVQYRSTFLHIQLFYMYVHTLSYPSYHFRLCSCTDWMLFPFSGSDGNKRNSPRKEFKGLWTLQSKAQRRTLLYCFLWNPVCPQHLKFSRYFYLFSFFFKVIDWTSQTHWWNRNAQNTVVLTSAVQECTRCLKSGARPFTQPFLSVTCCTWNVSLPSGSLCECHFWLF